MVRKEDSKQCDTDIILFNTVPLAKKELSSCNSSGILEATCENGITMTSYFQ